MIQRNISHEIIISQYLVHRKQPPKRKKNYFFTTNSFLENEKEYYNLRWRRCAHDFPSPVPFRHYRKERCLGFEDSIKKYATKRRTTADPLPNRSWMHSNATYTKDVDSLTHPITHLFSSFLSLDKFITRQHLLHATMYEHLFPIEKFAQIKPSISQPTNQIYN